jgi:hypothetical protein
VKVGWPVILSGRVTRAALTSANIYTFNWAFDGSRRVGTNCAVEAAGTFTATGTCNQPVAEYTWTSAGLKTVNLTITARPRSRPNARATPVLTIIK